MSPVFLGSPACRAMSQINVHSFNKLLFLIVECVHDVCVGVYATAQVWRSENTFVEPVHAFLDSGVKFRSPGVTSSYLFSLSRYDSHAHSIRSPS